MADNTPTGNTAGELNVKFKADASPVKDAAAEAKAALGEVGQSGAEAGGHVADGAEAAGKGLLEAAQEAKHLTHLLTKVVFPAALMREVTEFFAAMEERRQKLVEAFAALEENRNTG